MNNPGAPGAASADPGSESAQPATDRSQVLRRRAEARLLGGAYRSPEPTAPDAVAETLHELHVNQIELELQNEELRRTQEALEASRARYFDLYDLAPLGYLSLSEGGSILEANLAAARFLGVPRGDLVGQPLTRFVVREDQDVYFRHRQAGSCACELRLRRADGTSFWARLESAVECDAASGSAIRRTTLSDISRQRQTAQELEGYRGRLEELVERLRLFVEHAPAALAMFDREMRYIGASRRWLADFGLGERDLRGLSHYAVFPEIPERWRELHRRALGGEVLRAEEDPFERADGQVQWLRWEIRPWHDAAGQVAGIVVFCEDISERKEAELAQREADRRKDEFLATLAHELRNPLAPIRNAVEIMKLPGAPAAAVQTARDTIDRQVGHLARLVDDLLDASRLTRGTLALRRERVDLAEVLESAVEVVRPRLVVARQRLTLALPPVAIVLDADPVRLAQILANLLDNAVKYTESGGTIAVTAARNGGEVAVTVADTGIGIAPEDLPGLFEMFAQGDAAPDGLQGGLGIGLALARRLAELHGGRLEARSAGRGQGSAFVVRLPLPADPPPRRESPRVPEVKPRRILVADDNPDCAESLAMLLRLLGYEVAVAGDGLAAVAAAERDRPDTILLDLGMPKLDGYGACRRIRECPWGQDIAIFALTGWAQESDRRQSREAGFDGHLVKPVELAALLQALEASR